MNQLDKNRLLDAYQKGTIGSEDKRLLELAALEDAFLFDALEGSHGSNISVDQLRERLHDKVKKERRRIIWLPAVAATLLVVSAVMWWNNSDESRLTNETQFVQVDESLDMKGEAYDDMDQLASQEEKRIPPPAKKATQNPTIDGVVIAPIEKDKIENQQQTPKKQLDAYLAQEPSVSADGIKPQNPPVVIEYEVSEEEFAGAVVSDLNTEPNSEPIATEGMEDEVTREVEKNIQSTQSAPAMARAKAIPAKEKKRKMEKDADLAEEEYPILDEIVVTNMKTSTPLMGYEELKKFININKLIGLPNQDIKGRVRLKFTVDAQGVLADFKILKSINDAVDKHSIELMKKTGAWSPGEASYTIEY